MAFFAMIKALFLSFSLGALSFTLFYRLTAEYMVRPSTFLTKYISHRRTASAIFGYFSDIFARLHFHFFFNGPRLGGPTAVPQPTADRPKEKMRTRPMPRPGYHSKRNKNETKINSDLIRNEIGRNILR